MEFIIYRFTNHVVDHINVALFNLPYPLIRLLSIFYFYDYTVIWQTKYFSKYTFYANEKPN